MLLLKHLNIPVSDLDRSTEFYRRWFGFDRILAEYSDGTRFITDANGFELALHPRPAAEPTGDWHFGFLAEDAVAVRNLMQSLSSGGVAVSDSEDEISYVGFRCRDP